MSETTSILEAAREAHAAHTLQQQEYADSLVDDISPQVTAALGQALGLAAGHPVLADMIWTANKKEQSVADVLVVPMAGVILESGIEDQPIRATVSEHVIPTQPIEVVFAVRPPGAAGAGRWLEFKSLAELGSHLG